jgi:hypothetical protein
MPVSRRRVVVKRVRNRPVQEFVLRLSYDDRSRTVEHARYTSLAEARKNAVLLVQEFAESPHSLIAEVFKGDRCVAAFEPLETL